MKTRKIKVGLLGKQKPPAPSWDLVAHKRCLILNIKAVKQFLGGRKNMAGEEPVVHPLDSRR